MLIRLFFRKTKSISIKESELTPSKTLQIPTRLSNKRSTSPSTNLSAIPSCQISRLSTRTSLISTNTSPSTLPLSLIMTFSISTVMSPMLSACHVMKLRAVRMPRLVMLSLIMLWLIPGSVEGIRCYTDLEANKVKFRIIFLVVFGKIENSRMYVSSGQKLICIEILKK